MSFEYEADAALGGIGQGIRDGLLAAEQIAELGAAPGMTVYFAVDFDVPDYAPTLPDTPAAAHAKLGPVAAYFAESISTNPAYRVGVYGGFYACSRVLSAGLASMAWQTLAWLCRGVVTPARSSTRPGRPCSVPLTWTFMKHRLLISVSGHDRKEPT